MSSNSQDVIRFVKNRKANLIKVFGEKCCLCGYNNCVEALEFHHVHPEEKEFNINNGVMKALTTQLREARKCILVCANCHREIHYGYRTVPSNYQDFFNEDVAQELILQTERIKHGEEHYCIDCGKIISRWGTRCSECAQKAQRVAERPSREELKRLIRTTPFTRIASQYGVTDNAVRKWCDAEHLPRKAKDIKQYTDKEWELI